jgi:hypothetical protein
MRMICKLSELQLGYLTVDDDFYQKIDLSFIFNELSYVMVVIRIGLQPLLQPGFGLCMRTQVATPYYQIFL